MEQIERPYKYRLAFNQSLTNGAIAFEGSIHWDPSDKKTGKKEIVDRITAITHLEQMLHDAQGMFTRQGHFVVGSKESHLLSIIKEFKKHQDPDKLRDQLVESLKVKDSFGIDQVNPK